MYTHDPAYLLMKEIIYSDAGKLAAINAAFHGQPALAGVEPMIVAELGDNYLSDQGTLNAGYIVAEMMKTMGYEPAGRKRMPNGSVAKTAITWMPTKTA